MKLPVLAYPAMLLAGVLGPLALRPDRLLNDPGTGWHLKTGSWILDHRVLPTTDLFSFTCPDAPWIPYEWGFQVLIAGLERLGGLAPVRAVCGLLLAGVILHLYRRSIREGASAVVAMAAGTIGILVFDYHSHARPHLFTYLFFSVIAGRLADVARGASPPRVLWLLPVLMLPWCSLHPGFPAAFVLIGCHLVASGCAWIWTRRGPSRRATLRTALVLGVCVAVSFVNPNGWRLHAHIVDFLGMDVLRHWDEFASPDYHTNSPAIQLLRVAFMGLLLLLATRRVRLAGHEAVAMTVFGWLALSSGRHIMLFALVAIPPFARIAQACIDRRFPATAKSLAASSAAQAGARSAPLQLVAVAGCCLAPLFLVPRLAPPSLVGPHLSPGAAACIAAHRGQFLRPFNECNSGGTLVHAFWPGLRVFFDDRTDVYRAAFTTNVYRRIIQLEPGWREALERHDPDSAIVGTDSPLAGALLEDSNQWREIHRDATNLLLVREPRRP
jgi:hypothetical protein